MTAAMTTAMTEPGGRTGPAVEAIDLAVGAAGQRTVVLAGVALAVAAGERIALVGANGSGKTTLLRALAGLRRAGGRVSVDGVDWLNSARGVDLPAEERSVGLVFQEYALFPHLSVRKNVEFGRKGGGAALLERFRLTALADAKPRELSGGERQRVALARALVAGTRVLVLDDPMSAVDTETERHLVEHLRSAVRGKTVLISGQRLSTVLVADRAVVLQEGRIVEDGVPEELLRAAGPFSLLFGEEALAA